MKSLREDVLLSRLLQFSLFGTLLIIGMLLLLQEYEMHIPDFILTEDLQDFSVVEEADSIAQFHSPLWLKHSTEWFDKHLLEPVRNWK